MPIFTLIAHNGFSIDIEAADEVQAYRQLDEMLVAGPETGEPLWPEDFDLAA